VSKPICYDGCCGLGGWSEGFLAEGYRCVGFDIEAHDYGTGGYPGELILRDMRQVHGSELKDAACLVFSPPCQEYSYMAMPWSRSKQIARALQGKDEFPEGYSGSRTVEQLNELFTTCFRIQREAIEAAGHYIPMVIENVRGAQKWVGRANAHFGSFFLWGDVGMVGNRVVCVVEGKLLGGISGYGHQEQHLGTIADFVDERNGLKVPGFRFDGSGGSFQSATVKVASEHGRRTDPGKGAHFTTRDCGIEATAIKNGGDWFGSGENCSEQRKHGSKSNSRKAASALIAKIPFALSQYIAQSFKPEEA